jgi:hypothetical protein
VHAPLELEVFALRACFVAVGFGWYWGHVVAVCGELYFHARDVRVSVRLRSREPAESGNGERAAVHVAPTVWGSFGQFRGAMAVEVRTPFCGLRMGAYSSIRQRFVEIICVWVLCGSKKLLLCRVKAAPGVKGEAFELSSYIRACKIALIEVLWQCRCVWWKCGVLLISLFVMLSFLGGYDGS